MKKHTLVGLISAGMLLLSVSLMAAEPMSGNSNTEFGNFTITPSAEPIMKGKLALETYDLIYDNVKMPVKIGVEQRKNCKNFIVRYPSFEVQYVCNKHGFGVTRIEPGTETVKNVIVDALIDETQFAYQEVILRKAESDEELLKLIACYFPKLMKKEVRNLAHA